MDATVFYNLAKNAGLIPKKMKVDDFRDSFADNLFKRLFRINKLASRKHIFSKMIVTNGVGASVHFRSDKPMSSSKGAGSSSSSNNNNNNNSNTTPSSSYSETEVIGLDPGRVNLVYAVKQLPDGNFKKYILTRNEYYSQCGMKKRINRTEKWVAEFRDVLVIHNRHSPKTANPLQFENYIKDVILVYD